MTMTTDSAKDRAARAGGGAGRDGMIVGLGSGSTAALMVRRLGERIAAEGLKIIGVPTSAATAELARQPEDPAPRAGRGRPASTSTSTVPTRSIPSSG